MLVFPRKILKPKGDDRAFTLIELIVVMAIIAMLVGLAIPKYGEILKNSKDKAHNANVEMIENAAALYAADSGKELEDIDNIQELVDNNYLKKIPENPFDNKDYVLEDGEVKNK